VVALLGLNGAGKSTTADLTRPDADDVTVFGVSPREAVGMVAAPHREPMPVAEALRRSGIEDGAGRRCNTLSGGQKQCVRFAVALVSDPDLLVLDGLTAAVDVQSRREFWRSMHGFTTTGRTVLFATHYLEETENYADRVVLMRAGRLGRRGDRAGVRQRRPRGRAGRGRGGTRRVARGVRGRVHGGRDI
jgi:ABC-2 type transport system ATP-binding protein